MERTRERGGRGPHPHLPRYVVPHAGPLFRTHAHQTICLPRLRPHQRINPGRRKENSTLSNLNILERGSRSWKAPIFLVFAGVEEGFSICVVIILWLFNHSNKHKYHSKLHNSQHLHSNHRHYRHWRSAGWTRPHGNN
ncbi:hypothetical protein BHE74_00028745 [Ensete ventricosum]|nr:hypothetical protein GW17_00006355 [Ensete ventricosum]RWW64042.1 hypothetical protein BHE74_00028745 [Ensete ventricosum]